MFGSYAFGQTYFGESFLSIPVATVAGSTVESVASATATGAVPVEARRLLSSSASSAVEATAKTVATTIAALEALLARSAAVSAVVEANAGIATASVAPVEQIASAAAASGAPLESWAGLDTTMAAMPVEATGGVLTLAVFPFVAGTRRLIFLTVCALRTGWVARAIRRQWRADELD